MILFLSVALDFFITVLRGPHQSVDRTVNMQYGNRWRGAYLPPISTRVYIAYIRSFTLYAGVYASAIPQSQEKKPASSSTDLFECIFQHTISGNTRNRLFFFYRFATTSEYVILYKTCIELLYWSVSVVNKTDFEA